MDLKGKKVTIEQRDSEKQKRMRREKEENIERKGAQCCKICTFSLVFQLLPPHPPLLVVGPLVEELFFAVEEREKR